MENMEGAINCVDLDLELDGKHQKDGVEMN